MDFSIFMLPKFLWALYILLIGVGLVPNLHIVLYRLVFFPWFTMNDFLKLGPVPSSISLYIERASEGRGYFKRFRWRQRILENLVIYYGPELFKIPFKEIPLHIPSESGIPEWRLRIGK